MFERESKIQNPFCDLQPDDLPPLLTDILSKYIYIDIHKFKAHTFYLCEDRDTNILNQILRRGSITRFIEVLYTLTSFLSLLLPSSNIYIYIHQDVL